MADESVTFDIKVVGLKDLKEAANTFERTGKVSRQLAAQFKPVGAATERVVNETRKLESIHRKLSKAIEDGIISRKQANNAMDEAVRRSKEAILTDRNLIEIEKKKARAAEEARKNEERLVKLYAPSRAAAREYAKVTREIRNAHRAGTISAMEMADALSSVKLEFDQFTQGVATGGNQFAKFNLEVYKGAQRLKRRFNQGLQQAGYQVGDFIVQVQSGQSALVALGQQGSQLAGIFGPTGAIVGALLALGTATATAFLQVKATSKESVDNIKETFGELPDFFEKVGLDMFTSFDDAFTDIEERFGTLVANFYKMRVEEAKETALDFGAFFAEGLEDALEKQRGDRVAQARDRLLKGMLAGREATPQEIAQINLSLQYQAQEEVNNAIREQKALIEDIVKSYNAQIKGAQDVEDIIKASERAYYQILEISPQLAEEFIRNAESSGIKLAEVIQKAAEEEERAAEAREAALYAELQARTEAMRGRYEQGKAELEQSERVARVYAQYYQTRIVGEGQIGEKTKKAAEEAGRMAVELGISVESALELSKINISPEITNAANEAARLAQNMILANAAARNYQGREAFVTTPGQGPGMTTGTLMTFGQFTLPPKSRLYADELYGKGRGGGAGGGKDPYQTAMDYLTTLQREAEFKQQLVGLSEQDQRRLELEYEFREKAEIGTRALTDAENQRIESVLKAEMALKKAAEADQRRAQIQETISSNIESALMSVVDGTQSVEDAFKSMLRNIILEIYRQQVAKPFAESISSFIMGFFANGGVFRNGNVQPFANGGVVSSPSYFPMAGGKTGLMGEAGPEAIMPLKRGKNGKLGVQMEGGGDINIVQNYHFQANGDESVKRIISQETPKIMEMTKAAVADARQRGGSYGRAFG